MNLICVCLLLFVYSVNAFRVLLMFPYPIRSMIILSEAFVRNLIEAGHEVTYITSVPTKRDYGKKFRQIDVSSNFELMGDDSLLNINTVMTGGVKMNDLADLQMFAYICLENTFNNEAVKKLIENENEEFDLVVADLYEIEAYAGLSVLYNCPMIWSYSMGAHWQVLRLIDEKTSPAYTTDYLSSNIPPLTFQQRLEELWNQVTGSWEKWYNLQPKEEKIYKDTFQPLLAKRGRTLPDLGEVLYNASLIFGNEHHSFGIVPSVPLNYKPIGGYHIETPAKPLPRGLQELMDKSTNGVIYFSMGSTWKSKHIPMEVTEGLLRMFSEVKQTVIWKYEADLTNVPKNVHLVKWAPQPSILAHPNCHIFISHGGQLSSTEAIHFGVATIGVPIFFDQFVNINKAVAKGYAIKVPLTFNLPEDLRVAIQTMVNDRSYGAQAKKLSAIYHDRPVSPAKELVHWIEHVIKFGGAPHLRSPSVYARWYQKTYLDFSAILVIVGLLLYIIVGKLINGKPERKQKKN